MSAIVKLSEVLVALEAASDSVECYLDRRTGEVIQLTDDIKFSMEEGEDLDTLDDWIREPIQKYQAIQDTDDCLPLPGQHEIHEYQIMEDFIETVQENRPRQELLYAIQGKGAFRRFKDRVRANHIEQQWYDFRNKAFREIAIQWLEENNLSYSED